MKSPKVYIIILNWNGLDDTLRCLKSLNENSYDNYNILLIDNGSSDNSVSVIQELFPSIELICNINNLGFTGGNNAGISYALERGADYVWLLNNDTIVNSNSLSELVKLAETSDNIGLVSPLINYLADRGQSQFVGSYINWGDISIKYPDKQQITFDEFQTGNNVCLWGTALLIKKRLISKIGYLKEEYFAYWEDTEYSMRALRSGYKNVVCAKSIIYHNNEPPEAISIGKGPHYFYYMYRNILLLGKAYVVGLFNYIKFIKKVYTNLLRDLGECRDLSKTDHYNACLRGIWHGQKGFTGVMNNTNDMPLYIRYIFDFLSKYYPFITADILDGNFGELYKYITTKLRRKFGNISRN
jgi:GT2 family glycosyltransferase